MSPQGARKRALWALLCTHGLLWALLWLWKIQIWSMHLPTLPWWGWPDVVFPQLLVTLATVLMGGVALFYTERWFGVQVATQVVFALLWLVMVAPLLIGLQHSGSGVRWILAAWYLEFRDATDDGNAYIQQQLWLLSGLVLVSSLLAWLNSTRRSRVVGLCLASMACFAAGFKGPFRAATPDYISMDPLVYMVRSRVGLGEQWKDVASRPVPGGLQRIGEVGTRANVVVLFLESVGANATSLGVSDRDTTPFMKRLAAESLVGERTYVVTSSTYKAHIAALCGVEPYFNGDRELFEEPYSFRCLPSLLREQGYQTAYFTSSSREALDWGALVDHLGFAEMYGYEDMATEGYESSNSWAYEDVIMLEPSLAWATEQQEPFFAAYMVCAPHFQYLPLSRYGEHTFDPDEMKNRYLNSVRYVDGFMEELLGAYDEAGLLEDTIFVIVGDHGESFGEHMPRQHNASPYEEVLTVPLLVYAPGLLSEGRVASGLTSQLDITPTLLELLATEADKGVLQGGSLLHPTVHETIHTACLYNHTCAATVESRWKYIHHFGEREDELFDLESDPQETRNLLWVHPERSRTMREETLRWYLYGEGAYNGPSEP